MIPEDYLRDVTQRLAAQAEDVCRHLLAGGKRKGRRWICGGVEGGPGQSMNVELEGEKAGLFNDAASVESGTLLNLWMLNRGLKFPEAVAEAASFVGMLPPDTRESAPKLRMDPTSYSYEEPPTQEPKKTDDPLPPHRENLPVVDWDACVRDLSAEHAAELSKWRGFSPSFIAWLKKEKFIGVHSGCFAFPVHNAKGEVVRIHYRLEKGWAYHPKQGGGVTPLMIGDPVHAAHTLAFESQWDALAILDKLGAHEAGNEGIYSAIVTRGAQNNTDMSKLAIPHLIAFPQNDPPEKASKTTGRTPAEEWLHKIQSTRHRLTDFAVFETPKAHKDANDWIREENPDGFHIFKTAIEGAINPILKKIRTVKDLLAYNLEDDENALIGYENRFLSKGGSWVWIAPSGVGKSTLLADFCIQAATGLPWNGIKFRRPMKTLVVQAENDEGDMAEMMKGALTKGARAKILDVDCQKLIVKNYLSHQETELIGQKFCQWLEEIIRETKVDLVCVDPLLSYVGDDISLQKVASQFLRNWLQPVLERTGVILVILHHTGKPVKDGTKTTKGWSESDFSYMGLGSSEMVNWARAVSVIIPTQQEGTFLFKITKRGRRSGMKLLNGDFTKEVHLRHGTEKEGLAWFQTHYEAPEEEDSPRRGRKEKIYHDPLDFLQYVEPLNTQFTTVGIIKEKGGVSLAEARDIVAKLLLSKHLLKQGNIVSKA